MKGGKGKPQTAKPAKADSKLQTKSKGVAKPAKAPKAKAVKDPNKPKRPPSAFFVFMEEFRKEFKEKNPRNKSVATVGKAGGDRWKALSEADKAPYVAKASKRKDEYTKAMAAYSRGKRNEEDQAESEVHDDEDDEEEADDLEEDDDDE